MTKNGQGSDPLTIKQGVPQGSVLRPIFLQRKGGKERARKKGDEKKAMVALLVFIMAILKIFGRKNNCWR